MNKFIYLFSKMKIRYMDTAFITHYCHNCGRVVLDRHKDTFIPDKFAAKSSAARAVE